MSKKRSKAKSRNAIIISLTASQLYIACMYAKRLSECGISVIVVCKGRIRDLDFSKAERFKILRLPVYSFREKVYVKVKYDYLFNFSYLGRVIRKETDVYFFNEKESITRKLLKYSKYKVTMIEEGIGEYFSYFDPFGKNEKINHADVGFPDLFKESHPDFTGCINQFVYADIFNRHESVWFSELLRFRNSQKISDIPILYAGQPLDEFSVKTERELLLSLFRILSSKRKVYIKPHPRESAEKYDFLCEQYPDIVILNNDYGVLPLECMTFLFHISCMITFESSGGVNAALINKDIQIIFLCYIQEFSALKELIRLDDEIVVTRLLERIDNIKKPKTISELVELVDMQDCPCK